MSELYFDDFFKVVDVDPDGKKYDKVSRIVARSEKHGMHMLLDVNTELYPIKRKERFLLALSPSLVLNTKDGPVSIQEKFEYIMYGTLYEIADGLSLSPPEVEITASFGGLQLMLRGDPSHCAKFAVGQKLFLLIRKFES
ncbi:hypothetical protein TSUD_410960 [Trifolium subterraneum]|uniref:Uncharacterized protein n=1 Tax=Trifolium subterraneum TaxID=3900 RepID=A0A2Z6P549_TRISU|nr:hypothetical protein TSUD_410960 [Trifolium subterraneum]